MLFSLGSKGYTSDIFIYLSEDARHCKVMLREGKNSERFREVQAMLSHAFQVNVTDDKLKDQGPELKLDFGTARGSSFKYDALDAYKAITKLQREFPYVLEWNATYGGLSITKVPNIRLETERLRLWGNIQKELEDNISSCKKTLAEYPELSSIQRHITTDESNLGWFKRENGASDNKIGNCIYFLNYYNGLVNKSALIEQLIELKMFTREEVEIAHEQLFSTSYKPKKKDGEMKELNDTSYKLDENQDGSANSHFFNSNLN